MQESIFLQQFCMNFIKKNSRNQIIPIPSSTVQHLSSSTFLLPKDNFEHFLFEAALFTCISPLSCSRIFGFQFLHFLRLKVLDQAKWEGESSIISRHHPNCESTPLKVKHNADERNIVKFCEATFQSRQ